MPRNVSIETSSEKTQGYLHARNVIRSLQLQLNLEITDIMLMLKLYVIFVSIHLQPVMLGNIGKQFIKILLQVLKPE